MIVIYSSGLDNNACPIVCYQSKKRSVKLKLYQPCRQVKLFCRKNQFNQTLMNKVVVNKKQKKRR